MTNEKVNSADYVQVETFLSRVVEDKLWGDPDMSCEAQEFYQVYWREFQDLTECYQQQDGKLKPYGRYRLRGHFAGRWRGETLVSLRTVRNRFEKAGLPLEPIHRLEESYHCFANFMPWPYALNLHHCSAFREFPDLMFRCLRAWYLLRAGASCESLVEEGFLIEGELATFGKKVGYLDKDNGLADGYLSNFGEGEKGWKKFCDANYLRGSFVDHEYSPVYLIENHRMNAVFPKGIEQWGPQFVNNALHIFEERAKVLARGTFAG